MSVEQFNARGVGMLPGLIGIEIVEISPDGVLARLAVRPELMAPNGFLHAASVVALADTACGYGTVAALPPGAKSFTTIELKSNFTGTVRAGALLCEATPVHKGKTTHVWDARVTDAETKKAIAHFRCTQLLIYADPSN